MHREQEDRDGTIVFPCFNEARRLKPSEFLRFSATHPSIRLLFVDDGSTDATGDILRMLVEEAGTRMEILHLGQNGGKAEAVRHGFLKAFERSSHFIGFWDADLATPLDQIDVFFDILESHKEMDMVFGSRNERVNTTLERTLHRRALGSFFGYFSSLFFTLPVYDTQCGAKLFRNTHALERAFSRPFLTKWLFDIEILARVAEQDPLALSRVWNHPIPLWKDIEGSKLRLRDYLLSVLQFFSLYRACPSLRRFGRKKLCSTTHPHKATAC